MLLFSIVVVFRSLGLHRTFIMPTSALGCSECISSSSTPIVVISLRSLKVLALPPLLQKLLKLQISLSTYFFEPRLCSYLSFSLLNKFLFHDLRSLEMHLSSFLSLFVILFNRSIIRAWCLIEQSLHLVSREVKWVSLLVRELTQVASKESLLWFFDVAGNTTTANMTILIEDFLKLELLSGSSKFLLFLDWF